MIIQLPWRSDEKHCLCLDALHGGMIAGLIHPLYLFHCRFVDL